MTKHIAQTYQVLDELDHIRKRTGMYAGSVALQHSAEWVYNLQTKKMEKREISYIPALVKIFSEILDNAIDESRRAPDVLDTIRVSFDDGVISVQDNGRGIPVEIHPQTNTYIAETVFSNLRAGSNFNDDEDQQLIGTNGVGSTLTNVLSTHFKVESCDGRQLFKQEFWNGMRERSVPVIKADTKNRTKITFSPDYKFFNLPGLDDGNQLRMIKKIVDAAACNPLVKFYVNGDRIAVQDFDDYVALYTDTFVSDITPDWKVAISSSDGFEQISFINSVETYQGGSHIEYVMIQITNRLREFIKKKHKIEVKPSDIRSHMRVYIAANVNRPKFSSQSKENMISPVSDYKTSWTVTDRMINKIVKSPIIQNILDWAEAKSKAAEMAELRKLNKDVAKTNPKRVDKFDDAIEKNDRHLCQVFFTEGDCLDENTQVVTQSDSQSTSLKDIQVGDLVLTHNNVFRPVINKSYRLKDCIKFTTENNNAIICSREHRLMCYSRHHKSFGWATAETIAANLEDFSLIENELISKCGGGDELIYKSAEENGEITLEFSSGQTWVSSPTHRWMAYQLSSNSFKVLSTTEFEVGDMLMMRKN